MARNRPEYKINPLDLKKNTAIGVMLPMGGTPIFKSSYTTEEQSISNLKNLILTQKGERPFQPDFGTDVYSLLFEQMTPDLGDALDSSLRADIKYWLPYIIIDNILINVEEDYNRVSISMKFKITENGANENITILVTNQGSVSIL
jgi:phage baseplate assembly protein W